MASSCSGSVMVATPTTSAQPSKRIGLADGRRRREVDPVPVRLLQQLGLLVLGGRVEPEAVRLHREVAAVLAEPALAHVEDLLAFEQRVDDDRPFLAMPAPCAHNRRLMDDSIPSGDLRLVGALRRPADAGHGPRARAVSRAARPTRAARRPSARPIRSSPTTSRDETGFVVLTFNFRGTGTSEGDFSAARLARRPARRGDRVLAARDDVRDGVARGLRARRHVRSVRSSDRRPRARCRDHRRRRARCATGRSDPGRLLAHAREMGMIRTEGFPADATALGARDRRASTRSRPRSDSTGDRCSCSTGSTIADVLRRRRPCPRRRRASRTPSCGWCRARATGCATTRGRSPPCSAGSTVRCPERHTASAEPARWRGRRRARRRACARGGISGAHPVAARAAGAVADEDRDVDRPHEVGGRS